MAVGFELCGDLSAKTVVGLRSELALLLAEPARVISQGCCPELRPIPFSASRPSGSDTTISCRFHRECGN